MNKELQTFADNYNPIEDFAKIQYDWNGKYGEEFHDTNYDFRMKLCEYLIPQINTVNIELIRDIYTETTKSSEATFGIYLKIYIYAQELLRRDWRKYLMDYMQGASYSFDTVITTALIEINKEVAQEILEYITKTLETTTDENERKLMSGFVERFQWLATKDKLFDNSAVEKKSNKTWWKFW